MPVNAYLREPISPSPMTIYRGDIERRSNGGRLRSATSMIGTGCAAAVMHFAAFAYVGESVEKPLLYYKNNVAGSVALLRSTHRVWPPPVIFSSSCATYGIPESVPISEEHPQRPINPYGHAKLFVEQMLADVGRAYGLPWVALRYFNPAGAQSSARESRGRDLRCRLPHAGWNLCARPCSRDRHRGCPSGGTRISA